MKKYLASIFLVCLLFLLTALSACPKKDDSKNEEANNAGVYKSLDGGASWQAKNTIDDSHSLSSVDVKDIAIDSSNPDILYLATSEFGVFKTINGGEAWSQLSLNYGVVQAVVVDPRATNIVYAGGLFGEYGKIFKSQDSGENWEEVYVETVKNRVIKDVIVDSYDTRKIYAGNNAGGLLRSVDGGETWQTLNWFDKEINVIVLNPKDTRNIFVGTKGAGVFRSLNSGSEWVNLADKMKDIQNYKLAKDVHSIVFNYQNPNTWYLGSRFGLLRTNDLGDTWEPVDLLTKPGEHSIVSLAIEPNNSGVIYLGMDQNLYKTSDAGDNWAVNNVTSGYVKNLLLDFKNPNVLYAGATKNK